MWWYELLAVVLFAMGWWPCGACSTTRPPGPPGPPTGWPPAVYCTDICDQCTGDTDACHGQDMENCPKCATISLQFSSDSEPVDCPCDTTLALTACYFDHVQDDGTRGCGYQAGFNLDSDPSCAEAEWRATFVWDGLDLTLSIWDGAGRLTAAKTIGAWDCTDITYDFGADLPQAVFGIAGQDFCTWTGGTVSFGTCT